MMRKETLISYHVNSGDANALFVVCENSYIENLRGSKFTILCFDCGYRQKIHRSNIEATIMEIRSDFNIVDEVIQIDHLHISHPHSDHINYLVLQGDVKKKSHISIDSKTTVYHNFFSSANSAMYIKLKELLLKSGCTIVIPASRRHLPKIKWLFPITDIYQCGNGNGEQIKFLEEIRCSKEIFDIKNMTAVPNLNGLSPIVSLELNDKTLIITGDAEKESWNGLLPDINADSLYFHYPHHGSSNNTRYENKLLGENFKQGSIFLIMGGKYVHVKEDKKVKLSHGKYLFSTADYHIGYKIDWDSGKILDIP